MSRFEKPDSKIVAGLVLTAILFSVFAAISLTVKWPCGVQERCSFLMAFQDLKLNELGDLLAGIFSPIAFLWLVLAVLIQSEQLKAQKIELMNLVGEQQETRRVLSEQAEAAKASTNFIKSQTDILVQNDRSKKFESAVERFVQTCIQPKIGKEIFLIGPSINEDYNFEKKPYRFSNVDYSLIDLNLQIISDATSYFIAESKNGWTVEDFSNQFISFADQLHNINHWKDVPQDDRSQSRIEIIKKIWRDIQELANLQWGGNQPEQYSSFWREEHYTNARRLAGQVP